MGILFVTGVMSLLLALVGGGLVVLARAAGLAGR